MKRVKIVSKRVKFGQIYQHERPSGGLMPHIWVRYRGKDHNTKSDKIRDAENLLISLHSAKAGGGNKGESAKATLGDLFDLYIEEHRRDGHNVADALSKVEHHLRPALGNLLAEDLTTTHVAQYISDRRKYVIRTRYSPATKKRTYQRVDGVAPSNATINRELAALRRALNIGMEHTPQLIKTAPKIKMLGEDNIRTGFLNNAQYRRLVAALPDYLRFITVVGYHVGNRRSELFRLQWDDVELSGKPPVFVLWPGETKSGRGRTIPIYGDMVKWFRQMKAKRDKKYPHVQFVFTRDGEPIRIIRKAWETACVKAGVPDLLFHDLRRSAVRNLIRAGVPRHTAMQITGHRTDSVFRRYDIVEFGDLVDAGEKLAQFHRGQGA